MTKAEQIQNTDPELPVGLFNRAADNWRPLLAVAEAAGGRWPERAREAAALCCIVAGGEAAAQLEVLLADMRDLFVAKQADASTSDVEISSKDLTDRLVGIEGHPWAEMGKSGKPLTQDRLARMLSPIGIAPGNIGPENARLRGYRLNQFKDAFDRYLDPLPKGQPSQNAVDGDFKVHRRTERGETG